MISDEQGVGVVIYTEVAIMCMIVFILNENAHYRMETHTISSSQNDGLSDYVKDRITNLGGLEEALQNARNFIEVTMTMAA
jgi:hypothetical protein